MQPECVRQVLGVAIAARSGGTLPEAAARCRMRLDDHALTARAGPGQATPLPPPPQCRSTMGRVIAALPLALVAAAGAIWVGTTMRGLQSMQRTDLRGIRQVGWGQRLLRCSSFPAARRMVGGGDPIPALAHSRRPSAAAPPLAPTILLRAPTKRPPPPRKTLSCRWRCIPQRRETT
jgi:hypothetical protein